VSDSLILLWAKCGIVEMSGDKAQGFVCEVRSCSSVGSMYLRQTKAGGTTRKRQGSSSEHTDGAEHTAHSLHELECCTRAPGHSERTVEYVPEQYIIGCMRLKKSA